MKYWKSKVHSPELALELPKGDYAANFGFWVQQQPEPRHVFEAATALSNVDDVQCFTQSELIVKAQELDLCFADWAPLAVL